MEDIYYELDDLDMAATADQGHIDHLVVTIHQLYETNKIMVEQIKHLTARNVVYYLSKHHLENRRYFQRHRRKMMRS